VTEQFRSLIVIIGQRFTNPDDWANVIEQISLTYKNTTPKLLVEELKNAQNGQDIPDVMGEGRNSSALPADSRQKFE
jgi:hypothetical protein